MTIKFQMPLKPVPGGWIAVEAPTPSTYDDFFPEPEKESPKMNIYTYVVFTTDREDSPKWTIWDSWVGVSLDEFAESHRCQLANLKQRHKDGGITGYKIIASTMDDSLEKVSINLLVNYSTTVFEPKPKVYINGPKKNNEFLTKKAKQYANAKTI